MFKQGCNVICFFNQFIKFCKIVLYHITFRQLRSVDNELLRVPSSKTNIFENSFTITAAKQWNELPLEVRNSSSLNAFKNTLKMYLLNI